MTRRGGKPTLPARALAVVAALAASLLVSIGAAAAVVPFPEVPSDGWDTNGTVYAVKIVGGTVYLGGNFTTVQSPNGATESRGNLAAMDLATGLLLPFRADTDGAVRAIEGDGATVWVGGSFLTIGGVSQKSVAALDPISGMVRTGFDPVVNAPAHGLAYSEDRLYVGGYFTSVNGIPQSRMASLDSATGAPDAGFQAGADGAVRAIVVSGATGRLFAGGFFTSIGSADRSYISEIDPQTGDAVGPPLQLADAPLLDIDASPDGSLVFGAIAGLQNRAQAWNTLDGTRRWFHKAMGDTQAVGYYDGVLYFGFHEGFGGDTTVRLLAADVLTGELQDFRPTVNSFFGVWAIDATSTALAVGGEFSNVTGVPTRSIAIFGGDGTPPDTTPPSAPGNVTASSAAGGGVTLTWDPSSDDRGVSYYNVYRDGALIASSATATYVDLDVEDATTYVYQVTASDLAGNLSVAGNDVAVTTRTSLVAEGASWRYRDDPQETMWRALEFDDASWPSGTAQLGFGEGDESVVLVPGRITYYFRADLIVPEDQLVTDASLGIIRDDGAVVYVNGTEVFRSNMPAGTISSSTAAMSTTAGSDESRWFETTVAGDAFQQGVNVIAVEVHQRSAGSSDVSFDLRLDAQLVEQTFDDTAPTRPLALTTTPRTSTRIMLTWDPPQDDAGVVGYQIFRDGAQVAYSTALKYRDENLYPETEYTYKVYAVDDAGNLSPRSRISRSTTLSDQVNPSRPGDFAAVSMTSSTATLEWVASSDNVAVDYYIVKQDGALLDTAMSTSFEVTGLSPDTPYHFMVRAVDVFGNKSKKAHVFVTTPP